MSRTLPISLEIPPIKRGDTYDHVLEIFSGDNPVNLTGYTFNCWLVKNVGDEPLAKLVDGVEGSETGEVPFSLTSTETRTIADQLSEKERLLKWDLQVVTPSGKTQTWFEGQVPVHKDITRSDEEP